jgi:2'-hydroxyisoflavone reductase
MGTDAMTAGGTGATGQAKTALVLGGTEFVGRHLVEALVAGGWSTTLFNRGQTNPDLFPGVPRIKGDRASNVEGLRGGQWDVVFDVTAYEPEEVARTANILADSCDHYVLVSTCSAYKDLAQAGITEDYELASVPRDQLDRADPQAYGPLKALCELEATRRYAHLTVVRPCVIAGPSDPTDRFTYWVSRFMGGPVLVPPLDGANIQYIDVRDLVDFMVTLALGRIPGTFNVAGPTLALRDVLQRLAQAAPDGVQMVELTMDDLAANGLQPWLDLPLWIPPGEPGLAGFFQVNAGAAVQAGLRFSTLDDTAQAIRSWITSERGTANFKCGLTDQRQTELLRRP